MPVQLNHTIVWSIDRTKSSRYLTTLLGLPEPTKVWHFDVVQLGNGVSLDFADAKVPIQSQHYAFLVSELEFRAVFSRIMEQRLVFWADPKQKQPGEINRADGGSGVYFADPNGHLLEVITRPYGGG